MKEGKERIDDEHQDAKWCAMFTHPDRVEVFVYQKYFILAIIRKADAPEGSDVVPLHGAPIQCKFHALINERGGVPLEERQFANIQEMSNHILSGRIEDDPNWEDVQEVAARPINTGANGYAGYGPWDNGVGDEFLFDIIAQTLVPAFKRALKPEPGDNPRGNFDKARSAAAVLTSLNHSRASLSLKKAAGAACKALEAALASQDYITNYREPEKARAAVQSELNSLRGNTG